MCGLMSPAPKARKPNGLPDSAPRDGFERLRKFERLARRRDRSLHELGPGLQQGVHFREQRLERAAFGSEVGAPAFLAQAEDPIMSGLLEFAHDRRCQVQRRKQLAGMPEHFRRGRAQRKQHAGRLVALDVA